MRPRIKDVAARAGVSTATVSVVLNDVNGARVAESTRDRIRAAAAELGYAPNNLARGLRTQRTHTIGLLSDRVVTTPYAGRMILGAQEAAWSAGYVLMLVSTGGDPALEQEAVKALVDRQVDGLLVATMYHRVVEPGSLGAAVPTVVLDSEVAGAGVPYVVPDEDEGGYTATETLLRAGHRRIAYVRNDDEVPATGLREQGYRRALADAGVEFDPELVVAAEAVSSGGEEATLRLLSRPDRPTAVFAFNDRMAIGAYRAARKVGLRIPADLSVVGFDDQELVAAELDPGLTTVALPHHAMGNWAASRLIDLIQDSDPSGERDSARLEPCPLVVRGSVGPPPTDMP